MGAACASQLDVITTMARAHPSALWDGLDDMAPRRARGMDETSHFGTNTPDDGMSAAIRGSLGVDSPSWLALPRDRPRGIFLPCSVCAGCR